MPDSANNQPLYRSRMRTSIHGARLGLDDDGMLIGPPDIKKQVSTLGSTANALAAHGISYLTAAAASTYTLDAPMVGIKKWFYQATVGTSHNIITGTSNVKIASTLGSSQQRICLQSTGDYAILVGLTTALWGYIGGTAGVCLTT